MSTPGDFDHRVGSRLGDWIQNSADEPLWARPEVRWMVLLLCVLPAIAVVTTPLPLSWQAFFALGTFLLAVWFNRIEGRLISLMMMALSVMVSARYAYWRITETVNFGNPEWPDLFFAIGLLLAEAYAMLVLLLGYFQVLWPLQRKPAAMPRDPSRWPTVDIYIPTYNEPLKVVRPTILAALEMDWPRDRFNVYVLDDGRRGEFKAFCEEVGATHLTRNDSKHAKAGNLNRAMEKTRGEFVAIFDCDHVPTRSFLQISLGHFLRDERLGMLQTPHHFFSPDPFERNLGTFRQVPNEGELFYGLLQDGNDFWNATFFCGSCAVLRRTALDEVGGIAVETVTEDAHTSLKMHRRGWNTAYINLPQAAGLATESLSAHVGQRIRWARGMAQIFRIDNPFFGKGLKFGQRLCYANAMLHFFYGLPRVVFLTAPLSFLFFEAHVIEAGALTILAYALPHIAHSNLTNSRLQGQYRHSFWAEVYESVLATYILMPTTLALINPKLGTFNVTAKGGLVQQEYFDRDIAKPYLILLVLNLAGVAIAVPRLLVWNTHEIDTVLLNVMWTIYNLVIIGAALSVAWESRQIRRSIRVNTAIRARVRTPDGREIDARTLDISEGGTGLTLEEPLDLALGSRVEVALAPDYRVVWTGATVTRSAGEILAMQFEPLSLEQEKQLVYAIFGRADAWVSWSDRRQRDDMGASFRQILDFGLSGIFRIVGVTTDSVVRDFKSVVNKAMNQIKSKQGQTAALLSAVLIGLLAFSATPVRAQESAAVTPESAPVPLVDPAAATSAGSRTLTLEQLGIERPIRLRGVQGEVAIPVAVRDDELVTRARLNLRYAHSPALIYNLSHLNILLNNELAGTIKFSDLTAQGAEAVVDLDPRLFVEYNQLGLQAVMSYTMDCENPVHSSLWTIVSNLSTLELDTRPIDLANDLNLLPKPFFDERDSRRLTLPFVFAGPPSAEELEAAGVVASWFGAMASYRGASFPVHVGELPAGHAVVFSTGGRLPGGLQVSSGGAQLSIIANPRGRAAKLLVISGADGMGLNMAARALTLGSEALSGATTAIREFTEPAPREPYDAPRWIPTDRPVQLGELAQNWQLEASGLYPDLLRVPFHMPPDLFTWRGKGMKLDLKYRYTPTVGAKSTLNVNINNEFVEAIALSYTGEDKAAEDRINLPFVAQYEAINEATVYVPDYKFSADNTLQFQYYFERKKEGACKDVVLDNLRGVIDKDSTIDLTAFPHFAFLPDLSLFANGGFPFTRYADLSQTAIVLPDQVTAEEVEAYLTLMGRIGNATGYPAHRFLLTSAASVASAEDRDVLVIGAAGNQPLLEQWAAEMPMTVVDGATRLRVLGPIERLRARWEGRDVRGAQDHAGQVILQAGSSLGAIMSFASPLGGDRTAVVLTAGDAKRLVDVANLFTEPGKAQFIRGDLVLLNGNEINHYALGSQYSTGSLPLLLGLRWWFSQQPILLVAAGLLVALLVAIMGFRVLRTMGAARKAQS